MNIEMSPRPHDYLSGLLNVVGINVAIILAVIFLHELGHAFAGMLMGCNGISIMLHDFSSLETFTQMTCSGANPIFLSLSGFLLILPIGLAFLVLSAAEKNLGLVMLGFNMMLVFQDLSILNVPAIGLAAFTIAGLVLSAAGEVKFANGVLERTLAAGL